ncbi:MAG TPA: trehalose-6-phosphate synthase [Longimicrobiales bacterium]|nr:trehalose-6-phosphate synthase [Longimicrobiales bacterium]
MRRRRPDLTLAHFWHIPWPPVEIYRVSPQAGTLLAGLLANDLLGFQLAAHCENFLTCAQQVLGAEVDWARGCATYDGHTCHVRPFPISIDVEAFRDAATAEGADTYMERLRQRYGGAGTKLLVGVDRMDYSKGIPEKLKALDFLLERYPETRERISFVQIAVPSRTEIEAYDELTQKVERMVWEINERYATESWRPVHLIKQALPAERLALLYRTADVCMVASLQDGMNLVAKEFVASQVDDADPGVLLLSRFTGAAEDLDGYLEVNPYDPEDFALRIREAVNMPPEERVERMRRLQGSLTTIFDWMAGIFEQWAEVTRARPEGPPPAGEGEGAREGEATLSARE